MDFIKSIRVWPFTSFAFIFGAKAPLANSRPLARPYNNSLSQCVNAQLTIVSLLILTFICNYFDPIEGLIAEAKTFEWTGWILRIFLRDFFLMMLICGGWYHLLYESSWTKLLIGSKFNKKYPESANLRR